MADGSRNRTIGVGPVLRNAREVRGCSVDEAARDTKLRVDQLRALEAEDFDALSGDVYVRGSIRTYAAYLGVDPDPVVEAYSRHADTPEPTAPPAKMDRIERTIAASRLRDNPKIIWLVAAAVFVALIGFGFLSKQRGAPAPASLAPTLGASDLGTKPIDLALEAREPVSVTVVADGVALTFNMRPKETRSFTAKNTLTLKLSAGASVHVISGGVDLGVPGRPGQMWTKTWTSSGAGSSPSA
jgi:hypothetical protein